MITTLIFYIIALTGAMFVLLVFVYDADSQNTIKTKAGVYLRRGLRKARRRRLMFALLLILFSYASFHLLEKLLS